MPVGPTPFQVRLVTACQQVLALAVVCVLLTPALGVVSLDVVATPPAGRTEAVRLSAARGDGAAHVLRVFLGRHVQPHDLTAQPTRRVHRSAS